MTSRAHESFKHAIQDSTDLLKHFDGLNTKPPPPDIEVLKRASLVMGLAALETYFEDRVTDAVESVCTRSGADGALSGFYRASLHNDLKTFHSPSAERVRQLFLKYLSVDVTESWSWNNCDPAKARLELNRLVRIRGDIAHRSLRPLSGEAQPTQHAVTRDDLRKHLHLITQIVASTDQYLARLAKY